MKAFFHKELIEAGCDEAGRGCLAGPVFAAAVILPKSFRHPYLNDSKMLNEEKRNKLRKLIERKALAYSVAFVDNNKIDEINILKASFLAMHMALDNLQLAPELILVDGHMFYKYKELPHKCIIKGDGIYYSIAAASILAKTYRDEFMTQLHDQFPAYLWNKNKGYATEEHRTSITEFGISPYHRKSFRLDYTGLVAQQELFAGD